MPSRQRCSDRDRRGTVDARGDREHGGSAGPGAARGWSGSRRRRWHSKSSRSTWSKSRTGFLSRRADSPGEEVDARVEARAPRSHRWDIRSEGVGATPVSGLRRRAVQGSGTEPRRRPESAHETTRRTRSRPCRGWTRAADAHRSLSFDRPGECRRDGASASPQAPATRLPEPHLPPAPAVVTDGRRPTDLVIRVSDGESPASRRRSAPGARGTSEFAALADKHIAIAAWDILNEREGSGSSRRAGARSPEPTRRRSHSSIAARDSHGSLSRRSPRAGGRGGAVVGEK